MRSNKENIANSTRNPNSGRKCCVGLSSCPAVMFAICLICLQSSKQCTIFMPVSEKLPHDPGTTFPRTKSSYCRVSAKRTKEKESKSAEIAAIAMILKYCRVREEIER